MNKYQICNSCIMDTSDKGIVFDDNGVCNHCKNYIQKSTLIKKENNQDNLSKIIEKIKVEGKSNIFDCLIGISGGFDSTYICYLAKKFGLRPLLVHLDNGWDSEIAVQNIEKIIKNTNFQYLNHIINWEEFRDIQLAFLKASVVDIELPTDVAIFNLLPKIAVKNKIKYILSGSNFSTENTMGFEWNHNKKKDQTNIISIKNKFSTREIKTYPLISDYEIFLMNKILKLKEIKFFDYLEINFEEMKKDISNEFNWVEYDHKHGESFFTSFYQRYILPKKFNIDKRRAHLSSLICSEQITRNEAIKEVSKNLYTNKIEEENDLEFFLNKLNLTKTELDKIMKLPIKSHESYNENISFSNNFEKIKILILSILIRLRNKLKKL